ncbi:MAG: hypothetical protein ACXWE9_06185 [Methylobacter sp.]
MLKAMMLGIGGGLTMAGSSAEGMVMSIDKSYTFATHLRFLPAVLANFLGSICNSKYCTGYNVLVPVSLDFLI